MAEITERRRGQRVEASLKLQVSLPAGGPGAFAELETINISTSGVYFRSDHYIEPMTKLAMAFELPVPGQGAPDLAVLRCEGLVVRVEPDVPQAGTTVYEVAVFFTNLEADAARILDEHINFLLASP